MTFVASKLYSYMPEITESNLEPIWHVLGGKNLSLLPDDKKELLKKDFDGKIG